MPTLAIAILQFTPGTDPDANLREIENGARRASAAGARLLIAPEYSAFFAPTLDTAYLEAAQPLDGAFCSGLASCSAATGITIIAGMNERADRADRFWNTLVVADPAGGAGVGYRKVHLYDAFGARESEWIEPGDPAQLPVIEIEGVRIGLETCYDLRFPEISRRLAGEAAVDAIAVPAEWVRGPGKERHWNTLLAARAIENTIWMLGAGQSPPIGIGCSAVVAPDGTVRAAAGAEPELLFASIDTEAVARVRHTNPSLAARRYAIAPR
ncbi:carbon-nitrogen hydrolase family protein [Curtobacterium ammoniigenes]|uniref:carbon-nitrogen hydrolase family protein n=1 Tax=Curtobacterium ammoniigenes TaxID=395387 RepID=UPI00082D57B6|nr:carbon-nitrogen hydrolase family protein [Curtobacterium ammoniigenes]